MARGRKPTTGKKAMSAAQRQRRSRALKGFNTAITYSQDPRRENAVAITWSQNNLLGRITVDSEFWAAVEWSEKHQCWCIEDVTGACLAHEDGIRGAAESKEAAVALAEAMIRDGRMPTPEDARRLRRDALPQAERERREAELAEREAQSERRRIAREKRARQPKQVALREERQQRAQVEGEAWHARSQAEWRERQEPALYEALNEVFDLTDPELWKSNSFSALRPRLTIHLEAVAATLEHKCLEARNKLEEWAITKPPPWARRRNPDGVRKQLEESSARLERVQKNPCGTAGGMTGRLTLTRSA